MTYDFTRPFVDFSQLLTYVATDSEEARLYGRTVRAIEMSNADYSARYRKLSGDRIMKPAPSHQRIFAGYLVVRKLETRHEYETWMPSDVFEDIYIPSTSPTPPESEGKLRPPVVLNNENTASPALIQNPAVIDLALDTHQSVYREQLLEHLLIGDLLKYSWLQAGATLEVSQPSIDRSGHDVVLEANGVTRHLQLKSSSHVATTPAQKVHVGLASKPSGCVVWTRFDPDTMKLGPFLFFGASPGMALPSLGAFKVAKHTKGNKDGIKMERPNLRIVRRSQFREIADIPSLYVALFGAVVADTSGGLDVVASH